MTVQVDTHVRVAQERFKYAGLQGAMEGFLLGEAEHIASRYNALVTLLVHERALGRPDCLVRSRRAARVERNGMDYTTAKSGPCRVTTLAWVANLEDGCHEHLSTRA